MKPLLACALVLGLLAHACDVRAAAGAPVEERPLPPLLTPPGALATPGEGEAAAPDPLVSDIDDPAAPIGAVVRDAQFRQPTFADGSGAGADAGASARSDVPRGAMPTDAAGVLFAQLQDLQQEVMMLRGLVEEQRNVIDRLGREQRERYLDLDRRLALMGSGSASPGSGAASQMPAPASGAVAAPADGMPAIAGAEPVDERTAYERAFALTREKRFDEAIPAFQNLIETHAGGQYVPNAWYWLGELYLALPEPDLELARQAFVQVVQLWPDNRKVPDAIYKLGIVYDRLGEPEEARTYLERVMREHQDTPAARLASSYLDQIEG